MRESPALASQAERDSKISLFGKRKADSVLKEQTMSPRKMETKRSSRQSKIERKCSRFMRIPKSPK